MNDITIKANLATGGFDLLSADYQTLLSALIISANPDGAQIKVSLSASLYNPANELKTLQAQEVILQSKIDQDTAAVSDIQTEPLTLQ